MPPKCVGHGQLPDLPHPPHWAGPGYTIQCTIYYVS